VRKNTHPFSPPDRPSPTAFYRGIIFVGPQLLIFLEQLLIFRSKNGELLEINSFLPHHAYLGSWQTTSFGKKILGTLGDAKHQNSDFHHELRFNQKGNGLLIASKKVSKEIQIVSD